MKKKHLRSAGQRILRAFVVPALLIVVWQSAFSLDADSSLQTGIRLLNRATEDLFNESAEIVQIRMNLDRSIEAFAGLENGPEKLYWQSRVQYIYGFVEAAIDRKSDAKERFLSAVGLVERSLEYGEFSEGLRLLADAYAQLLDYNGLLYRVRMGRKVMELSRRAIELDSANVKARLTLAISYLFAPPIAGGSVDRGIDMLRKIQGFTNADRVDRFSTNAWLAMAFVKKRNEAQAKYYVGRALAIFPNNTWMRDLLGEIDS
jgi:tetratricopeptide (TPR) repeat protein